MNYIKRHLSELADRFPILQRDIIDGCLHCLELDGRSLYYRGDTAKRPYQVIWHSSGDRKVKGEWKAVDYVRSRCFGSVEKAIEFMEDMQ